VAKKKKPTTAVRKKTNSSKGSSGRKRPVKAGTKKNKSVKKKGSNRKPVKTSKKKAKLFVPTNTRLFIRNQTGFNGH